MQERTIAWEIIDQCQTADDIANLLRKHGIKGRRNDPLQCPLAHSTGWVVGDRTRWVISRDTSKGSEIWKWLTPAEQQFTLQFDHDWYPDLEG